MPELREGSLRLEFPDGWQAVKYDETDWYRKRLKGQPKGMDLLIKDTADLCWWVEIKDCEGFEPDNRPRMAPADPEEVEETKKWVRQRGWQNVVRVDRRKPFVVDEVRAKFWDTLAALALAHREGEAWSADYGVGSGSAPDLRVVLLLTWSGSDFKRLAMRLQQKLDQALDVYGVSTFVVNEQTTAAAGLTCRVTRETV